MEGKLLSQSVARIARSENLSADETSMMQDSISLMEMMFDGLGFCLSEEGDLLSQWRGYAADGLGVSVGFNKDFLQRMAEENSQDNGPGVQLAKVEYDPGVHDSFVRPTYDEMKRLLNSPEWKERPPTILGGATTEKLAAVRNAALRTHTNILLAPMALLYKVFLMKTAGFREEREWRLVTHLVPSMGTVPSYRASVGRLIPYKACRFSEHESPIAEVILGPKHQTPRLAVQQYMAHLGFGEVPVFESRTSYR